MRGVHPRQVVDPVRGEMATVKLARDMADGRTTLVAAVASCNVVLYSVTDGGVCV